MNARGAEVTPLGRNAQPAKDAVEGDVRFQSRGYFYTDGTIHVRSDAFPFNIPSCVATNIRSRKALSRQTR